MPDTKPLEERMDQGDVLIASLVEMDRETELAHHQNSCREFARKLSLHSLARELRLNAGLSQDQFSRHLEARIERYRDIYLQQHPDPRGLVMGRIEKISSCESRPTRNYAPLFPTDAS